MSAGAITWVVGAGGLLGGHLVARVEATGGTAMTRSVPWQDAEASREALRSGLVALLSAAGDGSWNIAWCAGAGVVSTPLEVLEQEPALFRGFLEDLADMVGTGTDGAFFMASSAGGVYAGSDGPPFTEDTEPCPVAPYGHVKLAMERDLEAFASRTGVPTFIARIANLYGPGQNMDKPQGLVSHLCRAHLTRQPLPVFVSLDTRRDYLFVTDCADMVADGLDGLRARVAASATGPVVTKILASGRGTTIGGLIGESTRLFRRRPPLVLAASRGSAGQVMDLRFRSVVWPELDRHVRTPLPVGLSATAEDIARRVVRAATGAPA
jgi:UDP-glucose 4-epimerase